MLIHRPERTVLKGRLACRVRPSGASCIRNETSDWPPARHVEQPARPRKSLGDREIRLSARGIYKGYTFADVSTPMEDGRYRARVAIMALDGTRTRSQRFIDLEVFRTSAEANQRVVTVARAWIDANADSDKLALPTNFSALE